MQETFGLLQLILDVLAAFSPNEVPLPSLKPALRLLGVLVPQARDQQQVCQILHRVQPLAAKVEVSSTPAPHFSIKGCLERSYRLRCCYS